MALTMITSANSIITSSVNDYHDEQGKRNRNGLILILRIVILDHVLPLKFGGVTVPFASSPFVTEPNPAQRQAEVCS
jgi:hypothetical protein